MTYLETLDYLYDQLPMFSRTGAAAIKEGLGNIEKICEALGNPQHQFKSIHVAGTNGKGSTSHMLASVFQGARFKTGLYTSPHLQDFRERIKINGEMIDQDFVINFVERVRPLITQLEPSFFEITVAMAFEYFASNHVDVAIIEVGLGGRLDSTNIIHPELSIITNISRDHANILGDTLEKIAGEKAGIIKSGCPVVIGERDPVTAPVFEKIAAEKNAKITFASDHRRVTDWHFDKHQIVAEITRLQTDDKTTYRLDLPGFYQTRNLVTVLESLKALDPVWLFEEALITRALSQVKRSTGLFGRWDIIHEHPTIVLDVAHNEAGMKALAEQLEVTTHHTLRIVIGMVKDKEIDAALAYLPPTATYYFTRASIPRALDAAELAAKGRGLGLHGNFYDEVNAALNAALSESAADDLILVCGSVFVVGEVHRNVSRKPQLP